LTLLTILKATTGLNTKLDPVRLQYDKQAGIQELQAAVNVDIDDTGRISRRKGFEQKLAGSFHSLFSDGGVCLCVTGDALSILNGDFTTTPIRNVTRGAKMSYVQVEDKTYYTNGFETGYVYNSLSWSWVATELPGPDTDRTFNHPPTGKFLEYYKGRMYVAQGDTLWYSEPFSLNHFDLHRGFVRFGKPIVMVKAVTSGIFVSTVDRTFFLSGDSPATGYIRIRVADYAALSYSAITLNGRLSFGPGGEPSIESDTGNQSALWISKKGICYGAYDGGLVNLTKDKIDLPESLEGASLIIDDRYIALIEP